MTARSGYRVVVREPGWDEAGTVRDPAEATASELAVIMRAALVQAQWAPDGDPAVAVDVLGDLVAGVRGPVASVAVGRTAFGSETLATVYLFCASVNKTIDRNHSAQPRYLFPGPARGPPASVPGMTGAPVDGMTMPLLLRLSAG